MKPASFPKQNQENQPGSEREMHPQPEYIRKNYKGSAKLKDKIALITGGDSGIGRSIAIHFAREGANVAIAYYNEQQDAEDTKILVENEGRKCLLIQGDLKDENFCRRIVNDTVQEFGTLNILVNNAAVQFPEDDMQKITSSDLKLTFETNIFPFFFVTQEALNTLKKGDCIINTASITAYQGSKRLVDYASTKGAIVAFSRSLAGQLVEKEIRVNAVAPGPIWTPLIPSSFSAEETAKFGRDTPMKRAGQPSEIAPAYVFLACEDSSYMTGQTIHINGGEFVGS